MRSGVGVGGVIWGVGVGVSEDWVFFCVDHEEEYTTMKGGVR